MNFRSEANYWPKKSRSGGYENNWSLLKVKNNLINMETEIKVKKTRKKNKVKLREELQTLKKALNDYKKERRANWKFFKNKMHEDIRLLKKMS